jgi:hypothetical protein
VRFAVPMSLCGFCQCHPFPESGATPTIALLEILRDLGVDFAQCYHVGLPEPVSALRAAAKSD